MSMKEQSRDWTTCEGTKESFSRRGLLGAGAIGFASLFGTRSALAQIAVQKHPTDENVLVVIFLRGGIDGLNTIIPVGDDDYYRLRPSLGIPKNKAIKLDEDFALHPSLNALEGLYREGNLAAVHAVGSMDQTRSHFEAMSAMERGLATARGAESSGWVARYLSSNPQAESSPLRSVAIASVMPDSLRGGLDAVALESIADYKLNDPIGGQFRKRLAEKYRIGNDIISRSGRESLRVLKQLDSLSSDLTQSRGFGNYPAGELAFGLAQVGALIRANVGLEVACLDYGGWDTHVLQGGTEGIMANQLQQLGDSIAAFMRDIGPNASQVSVIVMSEFGRRVYENDGFGTDHGRGTIMLAIGAGVRGGKVYGNWPGLSADSLEGPGDLRVTTDYRNVLAEMLAKRKIGSNLEQVFPGLTRTDVGIWE